MSKEILCNLCLAKGKVTQMLYAKKCNYYVCPECKGFTTEQEKGDTYVNDIVVQLMREKYKSNLPPKDPIPAGEAAKGGGGSKSKGRDRKGLMQKKSLAKLNEGLNGKDMRFESR